MKSQLQNIIMLFAISSMILLSCNQKVEIGFANINGTSIYYEMKGEGIPIILMHGFACDIRNWDNQFEVLSKNYKVIRYDLRGFGKSSLPDTLTPYSHVKDLIALLDFLQLDSVIIVGHSMGGLAAFEFTYSIPGRVYALVFAEGAASLKGFNTQPGSREVGQMFGEVFNIGRTEGVEKGKDALMQTGVFKSTIDNPNSERIFKQMVMDYSGWHWKNRNPMQSYKQIEFEDISNLQVPVLLINGELSQDHYHQTMQKMHKYLPNSKLIVLKNSGHMLNLENPDQFNHEVLTFLIENDIR
jgi:pimeloyl-ACP methyl ester carboxylesterase